MRVSGFQYAGCKETHQGYPHYNGRTKFIGMEEKWKLPYRFVFRDLGVATEFSSISVAAWAWPVTYGYIYIYIHAYVYIHIYV